MWCCCVVGSGWGGLSLLCGAVVWWVVGGVVSVCYVVLFVWWVVGGVVSVCYVVLLRGG